VAAVVVVDSMTMNLMLDVDVEDEDP
jgi:hypothetical protein